MSHGWRHGCLELSVSSYHCCGTRITYCRLSCLKWHGCCSYSCSGFRVFIVKQSKQRSLCTTKIFQFQASSGSVTHPATCLVGIGALSQRVKRHGHEVDSPAQSTLLDLCFDSAWQCCRKFQLARNEAVID